MTQQALAALKKRAPDIAGVHSLDGALQLIAGNRPAARDAFIRAAVVTACNPCTDQHEMCVEAASTADRRPIGRGIDRDHHVGYCARGLAACRRTDRCRVSYWNR
jgi:hypothetical protein